MKHTILFFCLLWIISIVALNTASVSSNKPAFASTLTGLTKTVGIGGDYQTLDEAFDSISTYGLTDSLTLLLTDSVYYETDLYLTNNTNPNYALIIRPFNPVDTPIVHISTAVAYGFAWQIVNFRNVEANTIAWHLDSIASSNATALRATGNCGTLRLNNIRMYGGTDEGGISTEDSASVILSNSYIQIGYPVRTYNLSGECSIAHNTFNVIGFSEGLGIAFAQDAKIKIDSNVIAGNSYADGININGSYPQTFSIVGNTISTNGIGVNASLYTLQEQQLTPYRESEKFFDIKSTKSPLGIKNIFKEMANNARKNRTEHHTQSVLPPSGPITFSGNTITGGYAPILFNLSGALNNDSVRFEDNTITAFANGNSSLNLFLGSSGSSFVIARNNVSFGRLDLQIGADYALVENNICNVDSAFFQTETGLTVYFTGYLPTSVMTARGNEAYGFNIGMYLSIGVNTQEMYIIENNISMSNKTGFVLEVPSPSLPVFNYAIIKNNHASGNSEKGLQVFEEGNTCHYFLIENEIINNGIAGIEVLNGSPKIYRNNIYNNGQYDITQNDSLYVDARENWFGPATTALMNSLPYPSNIPSIFDDFDNTPSGFVEYSDWLQDSVNISASSLLASVHGKVIVDNNANCTQDIIENGASHRLVYLYQNSFPSAGIYATTDDSGKFSFPVVVPGNYSLQLLPRTYWEQTCPPASGLLTVSVDTGDVITGLLFGSRAIPGINDLAVSVWSPAVRPGFTFGSGAHYENRGTNTVAATLTIVHPANMTFGGSYTNPPHSNYDSPTRTITWNLGALAPGASGDVGYYLTAAPPPTINIGDSLQFCASISPILADSTPSDNSSCITVAVRGSFDPNDKQVLPAGIGATGDVMPETRLTYQIQFQNTGTDTAFTIVVKDTLDANLDIASFAAGGSTHSYTYSISGSGILTFTFLNIFLPDSNVNEPASHGLVTFSISPKVGVPIGTVVHNTAAIYFDFNTPVITNTVSSRFVTTASVTFFDRWNLVSVPIQASSNEASVLFPSAVTNAFAYEGTYVSTTSLMNGKGYWMKFNGSGSVVMSGAPITNDTIAVNSGWNIVGSIGEPVPVASITVNPPGLTTSSFFGYNNGYSTTDTIYPGKGYWVKSSVNGSLILSTTAASSLNKIKIAPTSELPPSSPEDNTETTNASATVPAQFSLEQNYPNPFNPTTTIRYSLPVNSMVTLTVYDMLGREIATVVNEMQDAGYKSVQVEASDLPSGVYVYRIQAGSFSSIKKFMVMR